MHLLCRPCSGLGEGSEVPLPSNSGPLRGTSCSASSSGWPAPATRAKPPADRPSQSPRTAARRASRATPKGLAASRPVSSTDTRPGDPLASLGRQKLERPRAQRDFESAEYRFRCLRITQLARSRNSPRFATKAPPTRSPATAGPTAASRRLFTRRSRLSSWASTHAGPDRAGG